MSGSKKINITISAEEIDALKEEIRDYIIQEVEGILSEKMYREKGVRKMQELEDQVQNVFKQGADLKNPSNTDRNNSTPLTIGGSVREICEMQREGEWVSGVKVKVIDVESFEDEKDKRLQTGVMVDLSDDWKFRYVIWRKSGLRKLNVNERYSLTDIVSSVYGEPPKVEMQLNSKSEVVEVHEEGIRDLL